MVTKGWLEQEAMLRHAAGRGAVPDPLRVEHFVTEATACGVPLLARPRGADQRANATALESSGVRCGWSAMPKKKEVWMERWSWDILQRQTTGETWIRYCISACMLL
jgi:hypothetical protein